MIADPLPPTQSAPVGRPEAEPGETIFVNRNWPDSSPVFSVLVPVYHHDPSLLIEALGKCQNASLSELIFYDDGTDDHVLTARLERALEHFPGAGVLVTAAQNKGRSTGRNRLQRLARADWMIFLDADMIPDDQAFLERYLNLIDRESRPLLAVGGFSLDQVMPDASTQLHWKQCETSECLPADIRNENPGRFVFTSNVLVHKDVMAAVPFDDAFVGWGWEDVDWGLRANQQFSVLHIDNTATHVGLDTPRILLRKYGKSGENFWLAAERHPDELRDTSLYKWADKLSHLPGLPVLRRASAMICQLPGWIAPVRLRLLALKLYRAAVYGEARRARD